MVSLPFVLFDHFLVPGLHYVEYSTVQCLYPALRSSGININGRINGPKNDDDALSCKFIEDIQGEMSTALQPFLLWSLLFRLKQNQTVYVPMNSSSRPSKLVFQTSVPMLRMFSSSLTWSTINALAGMVILLQLPSSSS